MGIEKEKRGREMVIQKGKAGKAERDKERKRDGER